MAWFRHHYHCEACEGGWIAEAELTVEAECPFCGTHDVFAYKTEDRTVVLASKQEQPARPKAKGRAKAPRPSRAA